MASSIGIASASPINGWVRENIFDAAYDCHHMLLRRVLCLVKDQVGGKDSLDICFKSQPYLWNNCYSNTHRLCLNGMTPFKAMLKSARQLKRSPDYLVNT